MESGIRDPAMQWRMLFVALIGELQQIVHLWDQPIPGEKIVAVADRLRIVARTLDQMCDWIPVTVALPDFTVHGYHTGRKVWVRTKYGTEDIVSYQGYGIFGHDSGNADVTHWKPA